MCVCVCVHIYMYICVCIYDTYTYMLRWYIYGYIPLRSSHAGLKWHVPCCMHVILVYHRNKQASNVLLSIQFHTNVSQLLRHVLPWSYPALPSLGELSSSGLNRLSVCLSCLFCLYIPPVVHGKDTTRDRTCAARVVVRWIDHTYRTCGEKNWNFFF
jgi:hypothetical protein